MQRVEGSAAIAPPLRRPAQMCGRVVARVHCQPGRLDHMDCRGHHGYDGVVGGQELRQPLIAGFDCERA